MSLMNLHYKNLIKPYIKEFLSPKVSVRFVEKPVKWFFKKTGKQIIFNMSLLRKVKRVTEKEAVNFMDCLLICNLYYLKEFNYDTIEVQENQALQTLKAPFHSKEVEYYLKKHLSYTAKENYRNLEIVDDLEQLLD